MKPEHSIPLEDTLKTECMFTILKYLADPVHNGKSLAQQVDDISLALILNDPYIAAFSKAWPDIVQEEHMAGKVEENVIEMCKGLIARNHIAQEEDGRKITASGRALLAKLEQAKKTEIKR